MGKILLFTLLVLGTGAAADPYSILQGATSADTTHFTVVAKATDEPRFRAGPEADPARDYPLEVKRHTYPGSDWAVYRLRVTGLNPAAKSVLEVRRHGRTADRRSFSSLDTTKADGRVAVGSCMIRQLHNPFLWSNLAQPANRPDLLMIIGDAVYLDRPRVIGRSRAPETGLEIWEEFVRSRQAVDLYYWDTLVPVLTVWDDHDSGFDNADSTWPLMPEARAIFETFFANDEIPGFLNHGPGMAKQFQLFGKNFIVLDGRSFRNQWLSSPLFGPDQDRWLLRQVQQGPNIIVSGTQFFGGPIKKDSLEFNWPEFAAEWVERLRDHGRVRAGSFAFVSGDVHFSEVQDLEPDLFGYWTVEITSSNIHSFGFPGHHRLKPDNPRRRVATGTHNMVLLEFPPNAGFNFVARSMGWRGNDLFKTVVSISPPPMTAVARKSACEHLLTTSNEGV